MGINRINNDNIIIVATIDSVTGNEYRDIWIQNVCKCHHMQIS